MSDGVDIIWEAGQLPLRRRGRALVVLSHDFHGLEPWAAELARRLPDAEHVNLLDHFIAHEELGSQAGSTTLDKLFRLLGTLTNKKILVVSGLEFLWAAWSAQSGIVDAFAHKVETWESRPSLVIVTQYQKKLEDLKSGRFGHQFSFNQKDTYSLS